MDKYEGVSLINKYAEEVSVVDKTEILIKLKENGIVGEVLLLLEDLWNATYKVGMFVVNLGKAIFRVLKSIIDNYPGASLGIILVAVLDTFLWGGLSAIPLIGSLVENILNLLTLIVGTIVGLKNNQVFKDIVDMVKTAYNEFMDALEAIA